MIRLGDPVNDWQFADADSDITFDNPNIRIVRVDVRTEVRSSVYMDYGSGPIFLAVVDGYETLEFIAEGAFTFHGDAPVFVRSADSTHVAAPNTDEEIFTKMHERRAVAPEILEMQKMVHKNMERLKAAMLRDVEGLRRSTERQLKRERDALEESKASAGPAVETALAAGSGRSSASADSVVEEPEGGGTPKSGKPGKKA